MMGILHELAELEGAAVITLGDVSLHVGQGDRDAAIALLDFMDKHVEDGETTFAEVEALLVLSFLTAIQDVVRGKGSMSGQDVLDDRKVRMNLDALWWFRFLMTMYGAKEVLDESGGTSG
jgi:hypothetical protein